MRLRTDLVAEGREVPFSAYLNLRLLFLPNMLPQLRRPRTGLSPPSVSDARARGVTARARS